MSRLNGWMCRPLNGAGVFALKENYKLYEILGGSLGAGAAKIYIAFNDDEIHL